MLSDSELLFRTKLAIARWCKWEPSKPPLYRHRKLEELRKGASGELLAFDNEAFSDQKKGFPIPAGVWDAKQVKTVGDLESLNKARIK